MKTTLHHFAYNIAPDSLELVLKVFKKLDCDLSYRKKNARWCMIKQVTVPAAIQIIETKDKPTPTKRKINTHIAFLSHSPKEDIENIKQWLNSKNIKFKQGGWSDKELWFDLPDVFTNFVIEIMHTSVVE